MFNIGYMVRLKLMVPNKIQYSVWEREICSVQPEPMLTSRFQLSMRNVTGKLNDVTSKTIPVLFSRSDMCLPTLIRWHEGQSQGERYIYGKLIANIVACFSFPEICRWPNNVCLRILYFLCLISLWIRLVEKCMIVKLLTDISMKSLSIRNTILSPQNWNKLALFGNLQDPTVLH